MNLKLPLLTMLLLASAGLAACNTIEGAGRDIQGAGAAVENAAEDAQQ